jgi:hypothetical protein
MNVLNERMTGEGRGTSVKYNTLNIIGKMGKYSYLEGVNDLSLPALSNANE